MVYLLNATLHDPVEMYSGCQNVNYGRQQEVMRTHKALTVGSRGRADQLFFLPLAVPGDHMREPTFLSRAPLSFEIQFIIVLLHEVKATFVQKYGRTERRK